MPPLSAYTPFESLLFFQSLAVLDTRPANFISISDLLRNNQFVRDNVAFDAHRLSPEALEDLYTTLMRDGVESTGVVATLEPNGHRVEPTSPSNPKKRKISSPRPEGLSEKTLNNTGFVPGLVGHLYARYKELVTKEIRNEEKRFKEIRDEIERLQKEDREGSAVKTVEPTPTPVSVYPAKREPVPEPMDLDTNENQVERQPPKQVPVQPVSSSAAIQPQLKPQGMDLNNTKQLPTQPVQQQQQQPTQPQKAPTKMLQPQPQPQILQQKPQPIPLSPLQAQPALRPQPTQPATPANGNAISTPQQPKIAPRNAPVQQGAIGVPPIQSQKLPPTAPALGPSLAPPSVGTPLQSQQPINIPVTSATAPKASPSAKTVAKKANAAPPPTAQRLPPQASFQQWSLNEPQTPQAPPSFLVPQLGSHARSAQSTFPQQVLKPENKAPQGAQLVAVPSTPQPTPSAFPVSTPLGPVSGYQTPIGVPQGPPVTGQGVSRPPRLSIETPGSLTPWKQTPRLTLLHSPGSPDRPRPEDVSPISERASSPFGSREGTPEEPGPRRRKRRNEGKGLGRGREKAADIDQKGESKKKGEKATGQTGKKRDRSTTSSRSRGRSVVSREEESATESGNIKHEMPGTPAGIVDAEPERTSAGRKAAPTWEERPGRGRPKRKRAVSEAPEPEPPQAEPSQMGRVDPNQSTPYVLCTRNFPRTGAPIMNDVTTHKHASIFTKPLTERDAPGYRDLIYRPQDLKSIKSSIHQGSKALTAATEAANTPVADGESPAPNVGTPSKNAVMMLQKTEDVIPPRAIVNSAQLEKELIRMFANAVMFNPVPQRGFGPAFPMIGDTESRRSYAPEPEEGGIIKDTLEMFEDVEQAVTRWRAAERTADELATKSILSLRRGSASDPNTDSADDFKG
ncbi:hypothetical protein P175DRAFT_0503035 [Aspergillus ochraceoroseus IBT 24754]|uniref:Bromo domain-containing protein n=2 Tax=Aspergillus ochraceoroseus TaxID=138278 RepID=A0A2T5LTA1_9EURO|nr:uncharacterized protein P175DRAFT_0503035 [Aspergillus ochraceoroseus IBT 24754]KKK20187.1 hypothetical protein AOCH_005404 [Aspergillus ochraceoroseus]PTU19501.1 hypothetical protein P175DRAFT_0503035 [Aspergillus ochraceoroseus IBT 24754]